MVFWNLNNIGITLLCMLQTIQGVNHHFVILICSYNNAAWYEKNLDSVKNQTYTNFSLLYIDDASTDNTSQLVRQYIKNYNLSHKMQLITNKKRRYKPYNLYHAIHGYCKDTDIIVELDGDDWFLHPNVLEYLNTLYNQHPIWMTYGGLIMEPKVFNYLWPQPIPESIIQTNNFRSYFKIGKIFLALRSFYAKLFKQIKKEDLLYNGRFFTCASDVATMVPMFEMAGDRFYQITEPVYVYNTDTGNNDYQQRHKDQLVLTNLIRGKHPYQRLKTLF